MRLTHIDENGSARMVDVSEKNHTVRVAEATGYIRMNPSTIKLIIDKGIPKGDVFQTARIAGIMGAKNTSNIIPMCHNIPIDSVKVDLITNETEDTIYINAVLKTTWKTGIEMEALNAVSVTALTIYDMCKAVDKNMVIGGIELIRKTGGKSGEYVKGDKKNG